MRRPESGALLLSTRLAVTVAVPEDNPVTALPSFKAFQAQLKDRCVEAPVFTEVSVVGSYGEVAS